MSYAPDAFHLPEVLSEGIVPDELFEEDYGDCGHEDYTAESDSESDVISPEWEQLDDDNDDDDDDDIEDNMEQVAAAG